MNSICGVVVSAVMKRDLMTNTESIDDVICEIPNMHKRSL